MLTDAAPRVGGRVATLPAEVRLGFSDAIDPSGSGLIVTAPNGAPAVRGAVAISGSAISDALPAEAGRPSGSRS